MRAPVPVPCTPRQNMAKFMAGEIFWVIFGRRFSEMKILGRRRRRTKFLGRFLAKRYQKSLDEKISLGKIYCGIAPATPPPATQTPP